MMMPHPMPPPSPPPDAPKKPPTVYRLQDIDHVGTDLPPRFFIKMKSRSIGGDGTNDGNILKLAAETASDCAEWQQRLIAMLATVPKEVEEDDPYQRALDAKAGRTLPRGASTSATRKEVEVDEGEMMMGDDDEDEEELAAAAAAAAKSELVVGVGVWISVCLRRLTPPPPPPPFREVVCVVEQEKGHRGQR